MRRTNTGAVRRFPVGQGGGGGAEQEVHRQRGSAELPTVQRTLARITVVPVIMSRGLSGLPSEVEQLIANSSFLRGAPAIDAAGLGKRTLAESEAEVLLLDARHSRPSVVYRTIVRVRNAGWDRGIVLLVDGDGLSMVPVASSIGASDFVLSTASAEEVEARLRRAAGPAEESRPGAAADQTGIQLHWRTHEVSFEGTVISLTLREMQLLWVLMDRKGAIVTAEALAREAWGKRRDSGSALIAAYVCSLRKKLAWFGGRFGIQTVRAVGYRFVM